MGVVHKALTLLVGNTDDLSYLKFPKKASRAVKHMTERELLQLESDIGRQLFGPIPLGHRREFFNLDATTWIWYEEYTDEKGIPTSATTRYEIQGNAVLKAQEGAKYSYIEGQELANLHLAVQMYYERVMREVYKCDPVSGELLAA